MKSIMSLPNWSNFLGTTEACDVYFKVYGDDGGIYMYGAHRAVLADSSEVFKHMLFGSLMERGDCVVVEDIDRDTFHQMLQ